MAGQIQQGETGSGGKGHSAPGYGEAGISSGFGDDLDAFVEVVYL
jgi:hypothetical protein